MRHRDAYEHGLNELKLFAEFYGRLPRVTPRQTDWGPDKHEPRLYSFMRRQLKLRDGRVRRIYNAYEAKTPRTRSPYKLRGSIAQTQLVIIDGEFRVRN